MRRINRATWCCLLGLMLVGCGDLGEGEIEVEGHVHEHYPDESFETREQMLNSCATRQDTGYVRGRAFSITVVTIDGKPVERETGNAYYVMQQAAAREGVPIRIVSGFRTMEQQRYLYGCYLNKNCNNGNLAARPGYSNHQSGHALDLNTRDSRVRNWLNANGPRFGFKATVRGEPWHWEWWGGGPGGGLCSPKPQGDPQCLADANYRRCDGPSELLHCDGARKLQRARCGAFGLICTQSGGARCAFPSRFAPLVGDFNGDGKDDVATISSNGLGSWDSWLSMDISTGDGFASQLWQSSTPRHMRNGNGDRWYEHLVGDFDGDGKDDVATISKNGGGGWAEWYAMDLSRGDRFASRTWRAATPQHMRNGNNARRYEQLVGDFDGDGRDDVATISQNGGGGWANWLSMDISTGDGFASQLWQSATPQHMRNGNRSRSYAHLVGDFNGDGKADVATISKDGGGGWADWIAMDLSAGSGFASRSWSSPTPQHMRNGGAANHYEHLVGDFDGDGRDDIATISQNGGGGWANWIAVDLSRGDRFASRTWRSNTPQHMRNGGATRSYVHRVGDFNGDGNDDIATITPNGGGGWSNWLSMDLSTGGGFASQSWSSPTPQHMRNGGASNYYLPLRGDFNGDGLADIATITPNGGGAWNKWLSVDLSTVGGFASGVWESSTPQHMRNGTLR